MTLKNSLQQIKSDLEKTLETFDSNISCEELEESEFNERISTQLNTIGYVLDELHFILQDMQNN